MIRKWNSLLYPLSLFLTILVSVSCNAQNFRTERNYFCIDSIGKNIRSILSYHLVTYQNKDFYQKPEYIYILLSPFLIKDEEVGKDLLDSCYNLTPEYSFRLHLDNGGKFLEYTIDGKILSAYLFKQDNTSKFYCTIRSYGSEIEPNEMRKYYWNSWFWTTYNGIIVEVYSIIPISYFDQSVSRNLFSRNSIVYDNFLKCTNCLFETNFIIRNLQNDFEVIKFEKMDFHYGQSK